MSGQKYTEEEVAKIKDRILEALEMVIDPESVSYTHLRAHET